MCKAETLLHVQRPSRMKSNGCSATALTGSPSRRAGLQCHCLTAVRLASSSRAEPLLVVDAGGADLAGFVQFDPQHDPALLAHALGRAG